MNERPNAVADAAAADDADGVELFRRELLLGLPGLLEKAVRAYSRFVVSPPPEDSKGFVAYQSGCRAALAHVHLLVKLAHWARPASACGEEALESDQLERLVQEAEAALHGEVDDPDD